MTRLETISSYIEDNEKVIDVGCDQALLSKILAKRNIYSIASDIKENIISKASLNLNENEKKYITFRVGSGITLKEEEKDYTLVLSGMGTYTILDIINNYKGKLNKIITISNNKYYLLRKEMVSSGYIINREEIIKENNKYYNLIEFTPGNKEYTNKDLIIGVNHQNIDLLKEYVNYLINKYSKFTDKNKELENIVNTLKSF